MFTRTTTGTHLSCPLPKILLFHVLLSLLFSLNKTVIIGQFLLDNMEDTSKHKGFLLTQKVFF